MCRVFLYSRVSTSAQTLAQQERTVYEWLKTHNMKVDEIVSDEGVSGGVSYEDRNLGKVLLPRTKEGDMIIVSEVSRLGRSMFNLSELIHKELKPRKIRLVCVNMGIDLNCSKMTAIDELIISNFSFAAQLEKQLISERTLSALAVKRKQGVKFGAASETYKQNYNNKSMEEKVKCHRKKGQTKTERYLTSRDVTAFIRVLKTQFPESTQGEITEWDWDGINTKDGVRQPILQMMNNIHEIDNNVFRKWNFSDIESVALQRKLSQYIYGLRRSALKKQLFDSEDKSEY